MRDQQTLVRPVFLEGIGLHTGQPVRIGLFPAPPHTGIVFLSRYAPHTPVPAHVDYALPLPLSTSLGRGPATVRTVEHLLAALMGLGIDNLRIEVDGPEIPILDGSAAPFVEAIQEAGILSQGVPCPHLKVIHPVEVREPGRFLRIEPSLEPRITFVMDFQHPVLPRQRMEFLLTPETFARDVAPARTFGFLRDVTTLRAHGLAKGGSLENVIVIGRNRILNREGLRFPDECIRHKVLDLLGDLALLGMPFVGHVQAWCSGHALNLRLAKTLLVHSRCWIRLGEPSWQGVQALPLECS